MYRYSETDWPIFRVYAPADAVTDAEFEEHLTRLARVLQRKEPHILSIQLSATSWLSMERRDRIRIHTNAVKPLADAYQLGIAVIVPSAIQRAMASALLWMAKPTCPSSVFSDVAAADAWSLELLGHRGLKGALRAENKGVSTPRDMR